MLTNDQTNSLTVWATQRDALLLNISNAKTKLDVLNKKIVEGVEHLDSINNKILEAKGILKKDISALKVEKIRERHNLGLLRKRNLEANQ